MARAVRSGSRADAAVLGVCAVLSLLATVLPRPLRESMAGVLRRTVVAPVIGLQTAAERARSALLTRDVTASRIDSLMLRNARLQEFEDENERLRRLLGLGRQLQSGFVPAEALHGRGYGDEHSIVLTAGSQAGVSVNDAVVSPDGLIGVVTTVDPETSLAILWTHPDFRVSAMTSNGATFGIVKPHLGDLPERYLLEMRGVAFRDTLQVGTLVRSSGLGSVFPKGVPIGYVVGQLATGEGWTRTYLVRPAVKPSDVTSVMVLLSSRGRPDLSPVWNLPASADSARRGMASAADSLAALSARRDTARRDTTRRDTSSTSSGATSATRIRP